jgi:hypothetical protein
MSDRAPLPGENNKSIVEAHLSRALLEKAPLPLLPQRVIRRQFLLGTLQEKRILLPFTISAMGCLYLLLYAPRLGGYLAVGIISLLAGFLWAGLLLWRVGIHYQQGYTRKLHEMVVELETQSALRIEARLRQTRSRLEKGFGELQLKEGLTILHELEHEYGQLQPVINRQAEEGQLSAAHLAALVSETYGQGLNVLEHVLDLESAIGANKEHQLLEEIKRLEQKAAAVSKDPESSENLELIQEKITFNKERLSREKKLRLRVEELIYQADRCRATLCETHIELAVMKADSSDAYVTSVLNTLQNTIEQAKEVQAELKNMGY